ncbi:hypothetical protein [Nocardia stercoris]|uniref:Uncharacterized protein n=1 Tax=Nocardia stercoris TaxID=2483361 RepID=A0A3M2LBB4_9NOCA|nr:hypothetical protein [Nocardia stercoris]RMI34030.1 hypothetical protein EBN03_06205 [Nocardia stercoris]
MPSDGYDESDLDDEARAEALAKVVESWRIPPGAAMAQQIRANLLAVIGTGVGDAQLVADLAVGPLVMVVGRLEVALADAERRITALEQSGNPPDES